MLNRRRDLRKAAWRTNTLAIQDPCAALLAGGSIVWDLPVGALRVDFADVISKAAGDKSQVVNFGYSGW